MNWLELSEQFAAYLESDPKVKGKRIYNGSAIRGHCPRSSHEDKKASFSYFIQGAGWSCSCGKGKGSQLMEELGWKHQGFDWSNASPVVTATYDYKDETGTLLYQVLRYCPKDFKQRQPNGAWTLDGVRRVLYRLPELLALPDGTHVLIVDGEKDVEAAYKLGIPATCCSGSMDQWKDTYCVFFKGKTVTVIADKDPKGPGQAKIVNESLKVAGVKVNTIEMPGPYPPIKDLSDWIQTGETKQALERLMNSGPVDVLRGKIETLISLADLIDAPVDYVISPFTIKKCITLFQGLPKGGKSTFVLFMAICAAMEKWNSPQYIVADGKKRILYIPYEDARQLLVQRAAKYVAGLGFPYRTLPEGLDIIYRPEIWLEDPKYSDALIEILKLGNYDLLVLDTLSYVHHSDENKANEMVLPMYHMKRVAEEGNVGLIYIHHVSKAADGKAIQNKGRGSGAITAAADIIVDWGDRGKSDVSPVSMRSKWDEDCEFNVEYVKNKDDCKSVSWNILASEDNQESGSDKVLSVISEAGKVGLTSGQARELSGLPERTFYRVLEDLKKRGEIRSLAKGKSVIYTVLNGQV